MTTTTTTIARAAMLGAALSVTAFAAEAQSRIQLGSLLCQGEGGWGEVITSKKTFDCVFTKADRSVKGRYTGVVRKFGLDIGVTGNTTLVWLVLGPESVVEGEYSPGSLAGTYGGVGAEASVGVGLGANALVGGGDTSFALQPISVQVQTGLSIAAGVQTLELEYVGPATE